MKAKFEIGDTVTLSDLYFHEGFGYFGKNLRHQSQKKMQVVKVCIPKLGEQDGLGELVPIIYNVKVGMELESFCEKFLKTY